MPQHLTRVYASGRRGRALFSAFFAVLALAIGAASIVNARLVMRLGMHLLALRALAEGRRASALCDIIPLAKISSATAAARGNASCPRMKSAASSRF